VTVRPQVLTATTIAIVMAWSPLSRSEESASQDGPQVKIPGGCFELGKSTGEDAPPYRVCIEPFLMDKHETTLAEYRRCVVAKGCAPLPRERLCTVVRNGRRSPANCLTYQAAADYCEFVGKRLPTAAEWERAARGPRLTTYPWGEAQPTPRLARMTFHGQGQCCKLTKLAAVCSHPAGNTPEGLCDMAGNVSEWVDGWWADPQDTAPATRLPGTEGFRMLRGGSISNRPELAKGYMRELEPSVDLENGESPLVRMGVRCAADVAPNKTKQNKIK